MSAGDVLLVNPPIGYHAYGRALIGAEPLDSPPLSLLQIAASFDAGVRLQVLDLDLYASRWRPKLAETVKDFRPAYVGLTASTPAFPMALECAEIAKTAAPAAKIVIGGVHGTVYPEEAFKTPAVDYVVHGEGDLVFDRLVGAGDPVGIPGVAYRRNGAVVVNPRPPLIENLDGLGLPRHDLAEIRKYKGTSVLAPHGPAGFLESSRGCRHRCAFCTKAVFGRTFRPKSPARIVAEVEAMLRAGYRWVHFIDDGFGTDAQRIVELCRLIERKKLEFRWTALSGFAGDQWTREAFVWLKKAGCRRVSFGIESGNQAVLDQVNKDVSLDQIRQGVNAAQEAGLETLGFFILGLPGETRATAQETVDFAKALRLHLAKFAVVAPNPGTPLFAAWSAEGRIKSLDWSRYLFTFVDDPVYEHPNLSAAELGRLYRRAYRQFYLRPGFVARRFRGSWNQGTLLKDAKLLLQTKWWRRSAAPPAGRRP
jgi:radical SAM superfamily enzyme YgiQ (UPF0313 family)